MTVLDDPAPVLSHQGSARLRLRLLPATTLSVGVTVKVPTPKGQQVSGEANPKGGKLLAAGSAAFTGTQNDGTHHPPGTDHGPRSHSVAAVPHQACISELHVSSRRRGVRAEPGDGGALVGGSANPLPSPTSTAHVPQPQRRPDLGNTQVPVQTAPNPYGQTQ